MNSRSRCGREFFYGGVVTLSQRTFVAKQFSPNVLLRDCFDRHETSEAANADSVAGSTTRAVSRSLRSNHQIDRLWTFALLVRLDLERNALPFDQIL